jgi:hypothetical protein
MTVQICLFVCNSWLKECLIFHWAMGSVLKIRIRFRFYEVYFTGKGSKIVGSI